MTGLRLLNPYDAPNGEATLRALVLVRNAYAVNPTPRLTIRQLAREGHLEATTSALLHLVVDVLSELSLDPEAAIDHALTEVLARLEGGS